MLSRRAAIGAGSLESHAHKERVESGLGARAS